ncbi:hypothetical protein FRC07_009321 [Ceratobasidium sp. 392]|nr:hypothetical protein FRC07_009321 [Ceratobasidium sp. 392]
MPPKSSKRERPKTFLDRPSHEIVRSRPTTPEPSSTEQPINAGPFAGAYSNITATPRFASHYQSSATTSGPDILAPGLLITPATELVPTNQREATSAAQMPQIFESPHNAMASGMNMASQQSRSPPVADVAYVPPRASRASARLANVITAEMSQPPQPRLQANRVINRRDPHSPKGSSGTTHSKADGSTALKSALRKLGKVTSAMPPLGSVVDLLADCVDAVSITSEGREDHKELAETIATSVEILEKHLELSDVVEITEPVMTIVDKLKEQADYLSEKQGRAGSRRFIDVEEDMDDVMRCYRRLNTLFQQLQNNAVLHIWRLTKENWNTADETLAVS